MQSNVHSRPKVQLQDRIGRVAEGVLMLGGTITGLWLLAVMAMAFLQ